MGEEGSPAVTMAETAPVVMRVKNEQGDADDGRRAAVKSQLPPAVNAHIGEAFFFWPPLPPKLGASIVSPR